MNFVFLFFVRRRVDSSFCEDLKLDDSKHGISNNGRFYSIDHEDSLPLLALFQGFSPTRKSEI